MWGTIAKLHVKPGAETFLRAQMDALRTDFRTDRMKGWVSTQFFQSDTDPLVLWMVAMFESKEAYRRNAESEAQDSFYRTFRSMLDAEPEWNDVAELLSAHAGQK